MFGQSLLTSSTPLSLLFICSTYNFCGKPCNRVIAAFQRKNLEDAKKDQVRDILMQFEYFKGACFEIFGKWIFLKLAVEVAFSTNIILHGEKIADIYLVSDLRKQC